MHPTTTAASTASGAGGGSRRRPLARRTASVLAVLVAAAAATLSLTAAPALADDCPNAALRAQNNSTQLPDCRAYELVSPVFKEGFTAGLTGVTDDGRLIYLSNGNYANNGMGAGGIPGGNTYLATRTANGWATKGLAPSGPDYYTQTLVTPFPVAYSSDLRSTLWLMRRGDETNAVSDLYMRRADDVFTRIGSGLGALHSSGAPTYQASDDLSHIAFSVTGQGTNDGTYEYVNGDNQPRRVDIDNAGEPLTPPSGCASYTPGYTLSSFHHAISTDGRVMFLACKDSFGNLIARVNGTTTIDVSESQCARAPSDPGGPCDAPSPAAFQGANAAGTRVYFTTDQQLVDADTDSTPDLYECDIPTGTPAPVGSINTCPDLHEVSGAATGADVQGVTRISDDGSRAYFVATGVLASNTDANDAPAVAGDANLYVWTRDAVHPGGETRFVAKLDPVADGAAINGLWGNDVAGRLAQATDDGRYLLFGSFAPLIDHGSEADTDTARDIYRYDAETGALARLSIDANGQGGNEPGANANFTMIAYSPSGPVKPRPRLAMSDDGGSVVFNTSEALVPSDTNGTVDVYLWRDGRVSLISSGKPSADQITAVVNGQPLGSSTTVVALISPSGRDVYFMTTARMVSSDVDTIFDIYDARVDGGFDLFTPPTCSADACQSPPSAPPPATKPSSTSSTGQDSAPQTTPAFTLAKPTASQLRRIASTGRVSLLVTTNAPGTLSAKATMTIARRLSSVGSAKRSVSKAGTVSLSLTLSKKARAELKRKRKLMVRVLVGQDNVAISRSVSLKLTQPKTAKKQAKKKSTRTTSRHAAAKGGRS
jgi:hypothetical protein